MPVNKDIFEPKTLKTKVIFVWEDVKFLVGMRIYKILRRIKGDA